MQLTSQKVPFKKELKNYKSIDACITYIMAYAISIGRALYNIAIDRRDSLITSFDNKYINRDITFRLNSYKDHENVSDVCIWKESL